VLRAESRLVLRKYKPKIIAITGSVGKTSTKDAIFAVLSKAVHVRKSDKSYNSEIGLPITVLGLKNGWNNWGIWLKNFLKGLGLILLPNKYPKWLVLEVGISHPGDMKKTASWLKTDMVVITAIGETPAHIEFFQSRKQLIEEKSKLIKTLKQDGFLILNADDHDVLELKHKTKNLVYTYGFSKDADVIGSEENILYENSSNAEEENRKGYPKGVIFRVDEGGDSLPVAIEGVFGRNHIYASLAALAVASKLKLNMLNAVDALKNYEVQPGRMRIILGINGSLIIDDSYNSSPFACEAALGTLGEVQYGERKIAVLADMFELGKHTIESHKHIGGVVKKRADVLVVVGPRAEMIKEGALEAGMKPDNIFEFSNSRETGEFLKGFVKEKDLILVKGAQNMRMERAVEAILLDKENKSNLLVRQEEEWLKRQQY